MTEQRKHTMKVQLYTPHSGQIPLHECTTRFRVMACGRRFGKTLAATNELAKKALEKANSLNWWIAPTYNQCDIAFGLLCDALQPVMAKDPNKTKMRIELINGSIIEARSAERYQNMRGHGPNFIVFDEASQCPRAAWEEVVSPALADNQGGGIFISTPLGRDWFYELFLLGQDPDATEWWSQSFPTSANPFIPAKEIEHQRRTLTEFTFAQEFLAVFHDDASSVFRKVDQCIAGDFEEPQIGHHYIVGWDIAKYSDYSVLTVLDCNTQRVVAWQRFNGMEYNTQIDQFLVPMAKKYNDAHIIMDSTGVGDPVIEEVRKREVSVEGYSISTNTKKKELVDRTVVAIEKRQITYPNIPIMTNELKAYGYKFTESRNIIYSAPEGKHDDCVISLCLAVFGAKLGGTIPFTVTARGDPTKKLVEVPQVQQMDDAYIMQRQINMQKSLAFLGSTARMHNVFQHNDDSKDNGWGIV
jgi:hypothetical protein